MKHLDLFSGIGGFALAAKWAGLETVAFCEIDQFCQKVLKKHWPDVPIHNDIKEFDGNQFAGIDLLTCGYPCQPFSIAGKRKGTADDRHLWPEMRRIIEQTRPTFILSENVAGHASMGIDDVLSDMENLDYSARAFIIPACAVDADHRRDRVWIIANSTSENDGASLPGKIERQKQEFRACSVRNGFNGVYISPVCRADDGIPDRVDRNKALGNAIVPQIAYALISAMLVSNAELSGAQNKAKQRGDAKAPPLE